MYTNHAYETSSELDNVSGDSPGNIRVVPLAKDFNERVPTTTRVVSKQNNNKQNKSSTKNIITASSSDDHKRNSDHRHSNHHSRKGSRPNESNRQI
jgi:hypothetical protein